MVERWTVTKGVSDDVEDLDSAEALTELKLQDVAYRVAMATTDRVLQPTLRDFLR
jgi:flagellar hook-associated protein 3 FlgL